ncbi:MAG: hypothetical protein JNM18_10185 [Planctomycetaceae bacterium]|nr:hypothetical protein [Planctomycetaceae bacterium]
MTGMHLFTAGIASTIVFLASGNLMLGREQVGVVHGKPVVRDPAVSSDDDLSTELRGLLLLPLIDKYRADHPSARVSADEIQRCWDWLRESHEKSLRTDKQGWMERLKVIDRELANDKTSADARSLLRGERTSIQIRIDGPDRESARYIADQWKFQRTIYDKFEGGRIFFQQGGTEAFDAMRKWLEQSEKKGDIVFETPAIRAAVFKYWSQDHGAFLTRDPKQIKAFLAPEWLQKP